MRYHVSHIISTAARSTNSLGALITHHIYGRDVYSDNPITPITIDRDGSLIYDRSVNNPHSHDEAHYIATNIIKQILQQPQTAPNLTAYRNYTTAPYGAVTKAVDFIDKTYTIDFTNWKNPTTAQQTATASPATASVSRPGSPATPLKPLRAALEQSEKNENAVAVTLYFTDDPMDEEVRAACRETQLPLRADVDDPFFSWKYCPNDVSGRGGLCRVQCHPTV